MRWKRPKYSACDCARRTIYDADDGRHQVVVIRSTLGLPTRVLAIRDGRIVSRHRKAAAAMRRLERLARREVLA